MKDTNNPSIEVFEDVTYERKFLFFLHLFSHRLHNALNFTAVTNFTIFSHLKAMYKIFEHWIESKSKL